MTLVEILVTAAGVLLAALLAWFFFGPKATGRATDRGGIQEVEVTVRGGYTPSVIRVREGVPLRVVFDRREGGECTSEVVFPDFRVRRTLPAGRRWAAWRAARPASSSAAPASRSAAASSGSTAA